MEINTVAMALILIVGGGCALLVSIGRSESSQRARELSCAPRRRQDAEVRSVRRS
jgi:hypothetical protein